MTIDELLQDKSIKPKEKTETISKWILDKSIPVDELIAFAEKQKDPAKATSIEAIEYAGTSFAMGIQWQPEFMYIEYEEQKKVFEFFIEKCK